MRKLMGVIAFAAVLTLAYQQTWSLSGWLIWGWLPALWIDRQFGRVLPWPPPRPLLGAVLLRLGYFCVGAGLLLPRYPWVPLREAVAVGGALTWLAFGFELLLSLVISGVPSRRGRSLMLAAAVAAPALLLLPLRTFHQFHTLPIQTPAKLGLPFEEVRVRTADGVELAGWYVPHSQPRGGLIFCHGHGGNRQQVLAMLQAMHQLGLAVVALDFRGHGESPGHTMTFGHREVEDVLAAEEYLAKQLPGQPLFIAGVSYGGGVGLQALPRLTKVRAAWIDSAFARLTDVADQYFGRFPPMVRQGLIHFYSGVVWCDCGFWGPDISPIDALRDIRVPIHFAHGTEDTLIHIHQAQEMYDAYAGPKQCFWMEGADHFTRPTAVSQEYLRRFKTFIEEQLRAE